MTATSEDERRALGNMLDRAEIEIDDLRDQEKAGEFQDGDAPGAVVASFDADLDAARAVLRRMVGEAAPGAGSAQAFARRALQDHGGAQPECPGCRFALRVIADGVTIDTAITKPEPDWHCSQCGGTDLQIAAWVKVNGRPARDVAQVEAEGNDGPSGHPFWCATCETRTGSGEVAGFVEAVPSLEVVEVEPCCDAPRWVEHAGHGGPLMCANCGNAYAFGDEKAGAS